MEEDLDSIEHIRGHTSNVLDLNINAIRTSSGSEPRFVLIPALNLRDVCQYVIKGHMLIDLFRLYIIFANKAYTLEGAIRPTLLINVV